MRTLAVLLFSAVAVSAAACGSSTCPQPEHPALTAQPLGQPCTATADCTAGLACLLSRVDRLDEAPDWGGYRSCSLDCTTAACAAGSVCVSQTRPNDGGVSSLCLPDCQTDADCQTGTAAGRCVDSGNGKSCQRLSCVTTAQCPTGYTCEGSINICCPPGSACLRGGVQDGYCRSTP